jgi:hypothetical protein
VIVFVRINALDYVLAFKVELHEFVENHGVNRNLTQTDENAANDPLHLFLLVPGMLSDVLNTVPRLGLSLQYVSN